MWLVSCFGLWAEGLKDFLVGWWKVSKSNSPKGKQEGPVSLLILLPQKSHGATFVQAVQIGDMGGTLSHTSCGEKCQESHCKTSVWHGRSCCGHFGKVQAATVCTPVPAVAFSRSILLN